jgi:class I fructose-bisphosphate aldolase
MPLILWGYPRGGGVKAKGGRDSLYAVDYAARVACELGADVVKLNVPVFKDADLPNQPAPYNQLRLDVKAAVSKVVESAGRVPVIIAGGSRISDEDLLLKAEACLEAGASGLIFGRNIWQRKFPDALVMVRRIHEVLARFGR